MITNFKIFESFDSDIKEDDFVKIKPPYIPGLTQNQINLFNKFCDEEIGIVERELNMFGNLNIKFYYNPLALNQIFSHHHEIIVREENIVAYATTVDELKAKLKATDFNL